MIGRTTLTTAALLGLSLGTTHAQASASEQAPIPGMIFIEGGKTVIGSTFDELEDFILEEPGFVNMFAGELPQHTEMVEDFYLMPTEVTNEQYAAFVNANPGAVKPPFSWAEDAIEEARKLHVEAEGVKIKAARSKGERYKPAKFEGDAWWDKNWQGKSWSIPKGDETKPVCRVSYYDAEKYCAWAGLRLMTEQEFQRAARGSKKRQFTWDGKFGTDNCNSLRYTAVDGLMKVGSFDKGATNGIHDLLGNAYEWTSSKYKAFPGYEPLRTKDKRGNPLEGLASFDSEKRVLAGGCFGLTENACRISSRTPARRHQATDAVGFRCAADVKPGFAAAQWVLKDQIRVNRLRGLRPDFDATNTAVIGNYSSEPGTSDVPGYAVITGYDRTLFTSVESIPVGNTGDLKKQTESTPLYLGFLSFNHPLTTPVLDGGTYYLAWRSGGTIKGDSKKLKTAREKGEPLADDDGSTRYWELEGFDEKADFFVIYNLDGEPVTLIPAKKPGVKNLGKDCSISFKAYDPIAAPKARFKTDLLTIDLRIPGKKRNKGLVTTLELRVNPGYITSDWM